ncbi:hypothetical protein ANCCAN_08998 [Ancylostoma caninum]|uniref:Uncharacterized protein n=1 Tax=Ancylostoma caninum TaxID=29170 RepID=A0A368GKV8_ANCCA|nr:hypothetical protein ANCCAN_08998 [Ancylostoma caninum]
MFMTKFMSPTPPTPLLSQVPRNSSSPVSKVAFSGRCLLVSASPMTSCLIFLACIIKSSMEASDASVRALMEEESQTGHPSGSFHFVSRLLGRCGCRQHRRRVRSACSASPRQRKERRGFKSHQETTVLRDPQAYESRRQLPANVRDYKTVQRSDRRRPQGETRSSVGQSRRGREKHSQRLPRLHQSQD